MSTTLDPTRSHHSRRRARTGWLGALLLLAAPLAALAELPPTEQLLSEIGLSQGELAEIHAGSLVHHSVPPASDREITAGMAFAIDLTPDEVLANAKQNIFDAVNPDMIAYGDISDPASPADFAKLELRPEQVEAFRKAEPGGDVNLSKSEIAKLSKLGKGASSDAVHQAVREILAARVDAYRAKGLAAIEPYALSKGAERSPATEIETATKAGALLRKYTPEAYAYLLGYPGSAPAGAQSALRWSHFEGHGVPTIVLTHVMRIPDGDAWVLAKRQFYVSTGYNGEQEIAAFLPAKDGGTVVVYANRTSTDQVTGFGGGAKRSIGSKLLASQIEELFDKAKAKATAK